MWPVWVLWCLATLTALTLLTFLITRSIDHKPTQNTGKDNKDKKFSQFQNQYLIVYTILMFADWLQGTHMYTLYQSYGVDISTLFLVGFASSAIFGTCIGSLADRFGRKRACILYCVLEVVINILEHFSHFPTLLLGRVLGGVSTSLLFSTFEAWMVAEHNKRGFSSRQLHRTFSLASTCNGITAVVAGVVAQISVEVSGGKDIAPFQLAIALTVVAAVLVSRNWTENYGTTDSSKGNTGFKHAWVAIQSDPRVAMFGLASALFEGAMYTFVFLWVPVLQRVVPNNNLPTGVVFSCFMLCISIGGMLFEVVVDHIKLTAGVGFGCVGVACGVAMAIASQHADDGPYLGVLIPFLVVEVGVGMFSPLTGTLRSELFDEKIMSTLTNSFRLPLNILVVAGTKLGDLWSPSNVLLLCAVWFLGVAVLQFATTTKLNKQPTKTRGNGKRKSS